MVLSQLFDIRFNFFFVGNEKMMDDFEEEGKNFD